MGRIVVLAVAIAAFAVAGCQSPRASYAEGLIFWCSTSAIGIGFGKYIEVPAGGKIHHSATNSAPALIAEGRTDAGSLIDIDNTLSVTPCKCGGDNCDCGNARQDGAAMP